MSVCVRSLVYPKRFYRLMENLHVSHSPPCAGRPAPRLDKGVGVMEEM